MNVFGEQLLVCLKEICREKVEGPYLADKKKIKI